METKDFKFEMKNLTDSGTFEGYASTFNNTDSDNDIIEAGAFKRTLDHWTQKGKPIPVLWQHNHAEPIGATTRAMEDTKGLAVEGKLLMGVQKARDAYEAAKAGILGGLSIGFSIPSGGSEFDKNANVRRIKEVRLWEYSLVTFPANSEATITGVKSHELNALLTELREVTALLKGLAAPTGTPEPQDAPPVRDSAYATLRTLADQLKAEVNSYPRRN